MTSAPDSALLRVEDLVKSYAPRGSGFARRGAPIQAVAGVSFAIGRGETLGLVGESGCGKSTTARCVVRLVEPTAGEVSFDGVRLGSLARQEMRAMRPRLQMVFQDPMGSLNPRQTVGQILAEPLALHGVERAEADERIRTLLEIVQLHHSDLQRYPHQFSGGQRQRVGIVRALVLRPELVVLDEPMSALDVSIQAEVIGLLERLRDELGLAYLLIAHDLSVVRHLSERVAVMYLGKIVESGGNEQVYTASAHPYTQALLASAPIPDPRLQRARTRIVLHGDPPNPADPPSGCRFRTRCWKAAPRCAAEEPLLVDQGDDHRVACHFPQPQNVLPGRGGAR